MTNNKKYLKSSFPPCTGSITEHRDGTATLRIKDYRGVIQHNKIHNSKKAAMQAWYRYCN